MIAYADANNLDNFAWRADSILHYPKARWATVLYDMDGKVDAADMARWQNQGPAHGLLSAALRQALTERCHLAAHREEHIGPVFGLTLGGGKPNYKKVMGPEAYPEKSVPFREGRVVPRTRDSLDVRLLHVSMASVAAFVSSDASRPFVYKTGLAGLYDVTLTLLPIEARGATEIEPLSAYDLGPAASRGPTTALREFVVIDRLEPPTAN